MKRFFSVLLTICSLTAWSQRDTAANKKMFPHSVYERHSVQATISLGFIDANRSDYKLPVGFQKTNTSGYANVAAKLDYGLGKQISLAANLGYDAFVYNFSQSYQGNNGIIRRYKTNAFRAFALGLVANYHLGKLISIKHLDPFVGAGISLNNTRYNAYAQGDSTLIKIDHTVSPYLKAGAHYYISDKFSIYGDLGYEKQSIFSIGFSCRFFAKSKTSKK